MATHSSVLAWRIPWTEKPGGLQSMGSHRVRHDWSALAAAAAAFYKKNHDKPNSVLKSRVITLLTKDCIVEAMVFPIVMFWCESWTIKKAEHQWTDAFKLWCWRRLLRVPGTARISNQSVLEEINLEYSLEGLRLSPSNTLLRYWDWASNTLATWCKELTHWKSPWFWERSKVGVEGDNSGQDGWMALLTPWTWA